MNESIQKLLNRYKVDNPRQTTDKIAEALEVAIEALGMLSSQIKNYKGKPYFTKEAWVAKEALQKIQAIAEGE